MTTKWFEELPDQCPPEDAINCNGIYFRIANGNPVTSADFFSQKITVLGAKKAKKCVSH